jgi:hypothetical protein
MFVFGENLGSGNDGDNFQVGITSKNMLSKVELNGMFHLDATYQIVKYNFPFIILGVTDITRQFHPICYMFTSHEQQCDYEHFFDSYYCYVSNLVSNLNRNSFAQT